MAQALALGVETMDVEGDRQRQLRDHLWHGLAKMGGVILNGDLTQRLPGNLNISIEGVKGEQLLLALQPPIALSSGSACSSQKAQASPVLQALGRDQPLAQASLRFGLSRFTTLKEIETAIAIVTETVKQLRQAGT
jgi:cysteine desulfurase